MSDRSNTHQECRKCGGRGYRTTDDLFRSIECDCDNGWVPINSDKKAP